MERYHFSFFSVFLIRSSGQKPLAPAGGAGLGSSRASTEWWWVWGRIRPLPGLCAGQLRAASGGPAAGAPARGRWDERACGSWSPSLVEQPQFSQQLCNSSPSGRHKNVLKMTFFVFFFFFLSALSSQKLSRPGCQFKSSLNHSRRVHRISAASVIYTMLPGPLCSVTEK